MAAKVTSGALMGVEGIMIEVEVDISAFESVAYKCLIP